MNLEEHREAEDIALKTINSIPDATDISTLYERFDNGMSEEQHERVQEILYNYFSIEHLPFAVRQRSWICPICENTPAIYGGKCNKCLQKISKPRADMDNPVIGIGISAISNEDGE